MALNIGMKAVGPHTAVVLLDLWETGKIELTIEEYRHLVKVLSLFLEALEEARTDLLMQRRRP